MESAHDSNDCEIYFLIPPPSIAPEPGLPLQPPALAWVLRMRKDVVLEVCVESIDHAIAAERGGAHRIELCGDLSSEGITPSMQLIEATRQQVRLPIHIMIRPRAGDFVYSDDEFEIMERDIRVARRLGADGVVLGLLNEYGKVDVIRTRKLADLAHPLSTTFHRAFDLCEDSHVALEAVIQTGAERILTSGGEARVADGIETLAKLVRVAGDRMVVMPGGGVDADNVQSILQRTAAREIHTSLGMSGPANSGRVKSVHEDLAKTSFEFEQKVRRLKHMLETVDSCSPS